jgi:antitoxin (DNA-binding transcriptional repressor) of toxin-antitoxin stability system
MERAHGGTEVLVSRRGRPYVRLGPVEADIETARR